MHCRGWQSGCCDWRGNRRCFLGDRLLGCSFRAFGGRALEVMLRLVARSNSIGLQQDASCVSLPFSVPGSHCGASWPMNAPQKVLNIHVRENRPIIWRDWLDWSRDQAELDEIYRLGDPNKKGSIGSPFWSRSKLRPCCHDLGYKGIGGKLEAGTEFLNLFNGKVPLPSEEHADCALRPELRN
jgi:hypothetical protein